MDFMIGIKNMKLYEFNLVGIIWPEFNITIININLWQKDRSVIININSNYYSIIISYILIQIIIQLLFLN